MTTQITTEEEMTLTAATVWLEEWSDHLKNDRRSQTDAGVERTFRDVASQIELIAKRYAPKKTGALAKSITSEVRKTSDGWEATVTAGNRDVPYAPAQEFGTDPYIIRPKKAGGVLVFKSGGKTIFARQVNHPGVKPKRFMKRAADRYMEGIVGNIADQVVSKTFAPSDTSRVAYGRRMGMPLETGNER